MAAVRARHLTSVPMRLCRPGKTKVADRPETAPAPLAAARTTSFRPLHFRYAAHAGCEQFLQSQVIDHCSSCLIILS